MDIHGPWFNRKAGVFNEANELIGVVMINLFRPDCFNWERVWAKGLRVLVIG